MLKLHFNLRFVLLEASIAIDMTFRVLAQNMKEKHEIIDIVAHYELSYDLIIIKDSEFLLILTTLKPSPWSLTEY